MALERRYAPNQVLLLFQFPRVIFCAGAACAAYQPSLGFCVKTCFPLHAHVCTPTKALVVQPCRSKTGLLLAPRLLPKKAVSCTSHPALTQPFGAHQRAYMTHHKR